MSVLSVTPVSEFDINKLSFGHPIPGTAKNDPKVNFFNMSMSYGEEGEDKKLVLELPFIPCTGLIDSMESGQSPYPKDPSMYITLNPEDPEQNRAIQVFQQIYEKACDEYCKHKVRFGKRNDPDIVLRSQVTKILKESKYSSGCHCVSIKVPHWASIIPRSGTPVKHTILKSVDTVQAPLIVFDKFFIGSKVSVQFKLKESILKSVKERKRRIFSRAKFDSLAADPEADETDQLLLRLAQEIDQQEQAAASSSGAAGDNDGSAAEELSALIGASDAADAVGAKRGRGGEDVEMTNEDEPRSVRPRNAGAFSGAAAAAAGGARELLRRQPGRQAGGSSMAP